MLGIGNINIPQNPRGSIIKNACFIVGPLIIKNNANVIPNPMPPINKSRGKNRPAINLAFLLLLGIKYLPFTLYHTPFYSYSPTSSPFDQTLPGFCGPDILESILRVESLIS